MLNTISYFVCLGVSCQVAFIVFMHTSLQRIVSLKHFRAELERYILELEPEALTFVEFPRLVHMVDNEGCASTH